MDHHRSGVVPFKPAAGELLRHLLRRRRLELGLLQREVAARTGTTANEIGRYETTNRMPMIQNLEKLAEALDIPWLDILKAANTTRSATPVKYLKPPEMLTTECGTLGGAGVHRQLGEKICDQCLEVRRIYKINLRRSRGVKAKNPVALCGTLSGYKRHHRQGTKVCAECLNAHREYHRAYNGNQPVSPAVCGTISGYRKHLRNKSKPCRKCRAANAAYEQTRREKKIGVNPLL